MENRWVFHQVLYLFLGVEQVQGDAYCYERAASNRQNPYV
ncbi:Uncharacterised protein [Segatella copri]|nr:Uncharacterised protein [Segatella copri]